jgi:nucleoid-associated protein YgaU
MAKRSSRHAQLATYRRSLASTDMEVELYRPRIRQAPSSERSHQVKPGDRLDLLAFRFYDDPHQYWRLADANPQSELPSLLSEGRVLKVPEKN